MNITVTSTADAGAGSFRSAIEAVNSGTADHITFDIGTGPQSIFLDNPLPVVTNPVVIDGRTQGGFSTAPLIRIDGANAGYCHGLELAGGDSEILSLSITRFERHGVVWTTNGGGGMRGCHVGTDQAGTLALGNGESGFYVDNVPDVIIGGTGGTTDLNVTSANTLYGGVFAGPNAAGGRVINTYSGLARNGVSALGNLRTGFLVYNANNIRIGGYTAAERCVISGNLRSGITVDGSMFADPSQYPYSGQGHCHDIFIVGNYIGTSKTGEKAIPNGLRCVLLFYCQDCVVGGGAPGAGNVLCAAGQDALMMLGPNNPNANPLENNLRHRTAGNRVGVSPTGKPLGSDRHGYYIKNTAHASVGHSAGDIIRHSDKHGIVNTGWAYSTNDIYNTHLVAQNGSNPQIRHG